MKIVCRDALSSAHLVDELDLIDRCGVYAIVKDGDKLLLVNNPNDGWQFAGGGVGSNETPLKALQRELKEETGLEMIGTPQLFQELIEYFYSLKYKQGWKSHRQYYLVEASGKINTDGNNDDVDAAKYFNKNEIEKLKLESTTKAIINLLRKN